jgi:NitT/TauT family transport system substrate-binding protein
MDKRVIDRRSWLVASAAAALSTIALPREAASQAAPAIRIGTSPAEAYAQPFYAQDAGFFQRAGLNVDVQLLANGATVSAAVAGGALDFGVSTIVSLANAITRGVPFVMIAPAAMTTAKAPSGLLCVAKSSPYHSAKDLEGKTIAVPALKQVVDLAVRVWMTKGGADPAKAQIVESSFADMGPGIERGTFAGAVISEPSLTFALNHNDLRVLGDVYSSVAPDYVISGWITTTGYRDKNPEVVRKVSAALLDAGRWANTHHNESAAIVSRVTKVDVETIRNEIRPIYEEQLSVAAIQPQLDAALKFGFLTRAVNATELVGR